MTWDLSQPKFRDFLRGQPDQAVLAEFKDSNSDHMLEVLSREVARRGIRACVGRLLGLANTSTNDRVRAAAIESLWRLNATEAAPMILSIFRDRTQSDSVRDTAAYALGRLKYVRALDDLNDSLKRERGTVADCVAGAIQALNEADRIMAEKTITRVVKSPHPSVRVESRYL